MSKKTKAAALLFLVLLTPIPRHTASYKLADQDFSKIVKIKKGQNFA
jgi:hypothetical protein